MSRDCYCTIWLAKDGAHSFNAATEHYLGEEGAFVQTAIRRRMGQCRQAVARVRFTSPVRRDVIAMAVQVGGEAG